MFYFFQQTEELEKGGRLFPSFKTQISVLRSILLIMEHVELKLSVDVAHYGEVTRDDSQQQLSVVPCNMARITTFSDVLLRQNVASF